MINRFMIDKEQFLNYLNDSISISQLFTKLGYNGNGIHQRTIERYNKLFECDIRKILADNKLKFEQNKPIEIHTCKNCGKEFTEKYSKWSDGRFCCKECAKKYGSSFATKLVIKKCIKCNNEYEVNSHIPNRYFICDKCSSDERNKKLKYCKNAKFNKKNNLTKSKPIKEEYKCPQCGKILYLTPNQKRKRKFCSGTCRNKYNNQFINGSRSKGEILLYEALIKEYPNWNIISNDRKILDGLELDIFIKDIQMGIEWNGIYHYKNIRGNLLEQVQIKDKKKINLCKDKNIDLYVIKDLTSHKKDIDKYIKNVLNYINTKYKYESGEKVSS